MAGGGRIVLTGHASEVIDERGILFEWVERVLLNPERSMADPRVPGRMLAFSRIGEFGGRWLRVVYEEVGGGRTIITAFFDRGVERMK
jgi:Domain of unknown function (DUF4258)